MAGTPEIAAADAAFSRLKEAHAAKGGLPIEARRAQLRALRALVKDNAERFAATISDDFGGRSRHETLVSEIGVLLGAIDHALPRLARWSRPERVWVGWRYFPATGAILKEPRGVVAVLSPWNYPLQLSLSPTVGALGAGCRVLLKPSELAPATADLLACLVAERFAPEILSVVTGGPDLAAHITRLPLNGLVFTGSGRVGREVLAATAANLTPTTLELGGKSPALIDRSAGMADAAAAIIAGKLLNAGQTCVAPDYVLVPRDLRESFVAQAQMAARRLYPDPNGPDYTAVRGAASRTRLLALQDGLDRRPLFDSEPASPKLGAALLLDPHADSPVMREEIFGPLLPVLSYDTPEHALALIRERPDPLALYWFGTDRRALQAVMAGTTSGAVAVNETVLQAAVDPLPLGGVGGSGYGAYHGRAGFETFTQRRSTFTQSRWSGTRMFRPPYGAMADRIARMLTR
jgi:coniferyl-aldehyde dehydrogenase